MPKSSNREELKKKLKEKLVENKISRSSKVAREVILEKSLKTMGIDKDKMKKDLDAVKKQGGFSLNLSK